MKNYSPGPYSIVRADDGNYWLMSGGIRVANIPVASSYAPASKSLYPGHCEAIANATLLALAPQLLEMVQKLMTCRTGDGLLDPSSPLFEQAKKLVDQANGGGGPWINPDRKTAKGITK